MGGINIVGTGYVGSVIAVHFAESGHDVTAIDVNPAVQEKTDWFSRYNDLADHIDDDILARITATTAYSELSGNLTIICVDTPADPAEGVTLDNIEDACKGVGTHLSKGDAVIVKSTIPPGTSENTLIPALEAASGLQQGNEFYYGYSPEFLRGGSGITDFRQPAKAVVAGDDPAVQRYTSAIPATENTFRTDIRTAEAVKYADNAFHALKIAFANEVGRLGEATGFDPAKVMDILQSDEKLNLSATYLSPGRSFGGPCLQKDLAALEHTERTTGVDLPVLSTIRDSNTHHDQWLENQLEEDAECVGIIGAAYKPGFQSTVRSPALRLAERLEDRGITTYLHDPVVSTEIDNTDIDSLLQEADELVVFHYPENIDRGHLSSFDGRVIDLTQFTMSGGPRNPHS